MASYELFSFIFNQGYFQTDFAYSIDLSLQLGPTKVVNSLAYDVEVWRMSEIVKNLVTSSWSIFSLRKLFFAISVLM